MLSVGDAVKRLFICALVVGLMLLTSSPARLCALFTSTAGDCTSMATQPECANMDMGASVAQKIAARNASCCAVSQAPLPESNTEAYKTSVPMAPTEDLLSATAVVKSESATSRDVTQSLSPPALQPLLCTFLI